MAEEVKVEGMEWLRGRARPIEATTSTEVRDWSTLALSDRESFVVGVQSMGFPKPIADEAISIRDSAERDVNEAVRAFWQNHPYRYHTPSPEVEKELAWVYNSARRNAWRRLRNWWSETVIEVESRDTIPLRLPLFILSAPSSAGSSTEFMTSSTREDGVIWSMSIVGSGFSDEGKVLISTSATFQATEGQIKVIFLPVSIIVESILISKHGDAVVRGHRIDISGLRDQHPAPGSRLLGRTARLPCGHLEQVYPLSGDDSGSVATYKYEYQRGLLASSKLGIKLRGLDIGVRAETRTEASASLSFALRGGVDYRLYRCLEGHGILWG